ncbi:MAG: BBE domain-containing protein, partial [Candidatus Methylomirabilales bacterium]
GMSYGDTMRYWGKLDHLSGGHSDAAPTNMDLEPQYLLAKTEFFKRPLPTEAIGALIENFTDDRAPGQYRELDFMAWGGAYNKVPADVTAFVHRDPLFLLKHAIILDPSVPNLDEHAAHRWVAESWALVHPWGTGGAFPNFSDPDLENWAEAYYGANYDRLLRIKAQYDPENFFRSRQSLTVG